VVFRQGNHAVQALPPERADEPLAERIGLGILGWSSQHLESQVVDTAVELCREDAIPVMEEETVAMVRRDRFAQLLQRPDRRGVRRDIDVEDAPRGVFHHDKHVEQAKGRRDHYTEVTGHDRPRMIAHKGAPALGRGAFASPTLEAFGHVLSDRPRRHA